MLFLLAKIAPAVLAIIVLFLFMRRNLRRERLYAWWLSRFGKDYLCGCGHAAKRKTTLPFDGSPGVYTLDPKNLDHCPHCWAKAAIKCAWCGKTIVPGDPITLSSSSRKDFVPPKYAVRYDKDPRWLIGCMRWECADSGACRSGYWVMPGRVERVLSPIEMCITKAQQGDFSPVIIHDINDLSQAIPMHEVPRPTS